MTTSPFTPLESKTYTKIPRLRRWLTGSAAILRRHLTSARIEAALTAAFFVAGLLAAAAGLALIYQPAGLIFAGTASAACAWLYRRSDA